MLAEKLQKAARDNDDGLFDLRLDSKFQILSPAKGQGQPAQALER